MTRRHRMRRALPNTHPNETAERDTKNDVVTFPAKEGTRQRTFDLGGLPLGETIKDVFRFAIEHHPIPIAYATQRHYWYAITTFARFAEEQGLRTASDLTTKCIEHYREWLDTQTSKRTRTQWSEAHRGKKMIALRELMRTVKMWKPDLLPSEIVLPMYCYPDGSPKSTTRKHHLSRGELKSLTWACQQDIKENKQRFDRGRKILAGEQKETFAGMQHALLTAERLTRTGIATHQRMLAEGVHERLIGKLGGSEGLRSHVAATPRTLAPIVISLLMQLAGNVDPIRKMKTDCVGICEVRKHWVAITWEKPRAGPARQGMQLRFGDTTKRYGAPALIAMTITMTAPFRDITKAEDRDRLFICETTRGGDPGHRLLSYCSLKGAAAEFLQDARARIARWNEQHPDKPREQLDKFNLREIRGSVAVEKYIASGGDIRSTQRWLNHQRPALTTTYIDGERTKDKNIQILSEIQRKMVRSAAKAARDGAKGTKNRRSNATQDKPATASFTHACRAPEGEEGQLCRHFQQCMDCPGLIIPITAERLARLLQAEETFRKAKERLHPERWKRLYARSYATLTSEILPRFPTTMEPEARTLMPSLPPLPDLE